MLPNIYYLSQNYIYIPDTQILQYNMRYTNIYEGQFGNLSSSLITYLHAGKLKQT